MITQSRLKELLSYDPVTGDFTWRVTSRNKYAVKGEKIKNIDQFGYARVYLDGARYKLHRLAWLCVYGVWPKEQLDHLNHDKADNRISNLREVSNDENQKNKPLYSTNKSGFAGVCWHKATSKWTATICIKTKKKYLGVFKDKQDAINARKEANTLYGFHENHGAKR